MITLRRYYTPHGTWGELTGQNGFRCVTMENPWLGNERGESCIPEGVYKMRLRPSPVVQRTSNGMYSDGWEICDVPGRDFIMAHPGNYVRDTDGCLLVGRKMTVHGGRLMVTHSQATFQQFMDALDGPVEHDIDIRQWQPQWP